MRKTSLVESISGLEVGRNTIILEIVREYFPLCRTMWKSACADGYGLDMAERMGDTPNATTMKDCTSTMVSLTYLSMHLGNTHEATRKNSLREPYSGDPNVRFDEGQLENGLWPCACQPVLAAYSTLTSPTTYSLEALQIEIVLLKCLFLFNNHYLGQALFNNRHRPRLINREIL